MLKWSLITSVVVQYLLSISPVYGQDSTIRNFRHELNGVGIYGGIGWSSFGKGTTIKYNTWTFLPHGGLHARWFLAKKVAVFHSLDYLSLGARNRTSTSIDENRLRTLQLSNSIELFLNGKPTKPILSVRGGGPRSNR